MVKWCSGMHSTTPLLQPYEFLSEVNRAMQDLRDWLKEVEGLGQLKRIKGAEAAMIGPAHCALRDAARGPQAGTWVVAR